MREAMKVLGASSTHHGGLEAVAKTSGRKHITALIAVLASGPIAPLFLSWLVTT